MQQAHAQTKEQLGNVQQAHAQTKEQLGTVQQAHAQTKEQLGTVQQAHAQTKEQLGTEQQAHAQIKEELDGLKKIRDSIGLQLVESQSKNKNLEVQYQKQIEELNDKIARLEKVIEESNTNKILVEDISQLNQTEVQKKFKQLVVDKEKQQNLIEQLSSSKELTCANLIESKLIPFTQDYLQHLRKEAEKLNPTFTTDRTIFSGAEEYREMYEKVIIKYSATEKLLNILTDNKSNPLPSARIVSFTESLKATNTQLKEHRDSEWTTFFRNSIIAIGVVCSGIIPGIIALLAYSSIKGKSPLFFTESKGSQYIENVGQAYQAYTGKSASFFAQCLSGEEEITDEVLNNSSAAATAA